MTPVCIKCGEEIPELVFYTIPKDEGMKAVVITKDNQQALMSRYGAEPYDTEQFPVGYIMVTAFGDNGESRYEGVLTETKFNELFVKGEKLHNGFYSIFSKDEVRYNRNLQGNL